MTYHYGFSAAMGGGEYGRADTFASGLEPVIKVPADQTTIQAALDQLAASGGVVEIEDNDYYIETPLITVPAGKKIELRAADERRPVLVLGSELVIVGGENAQVTLNGLVICGGTLRVPSQDEHTRATQSTSCGCSIARFCLVLAQRSKACRHNLPCPDSASNCQTLSSRSSNV